MTVVPWDKLVARALSQAATPFYLLSWPHVATKLELLRQAVPIRHWLSVKTQPVRPLLGACLKAGIGAEVVSEYELRAALDVGFTTNNIVVNGVAKHTWLPRISGQGLHVNFDSLHELKCLLEAGLPSAWHVGLRLHLSLEHDPDRPAYATQFGLTMEESVVAAKLLRAAGSSVQGIHFHLRSNVETPEIYGQAIAEVAEICRVAAIEPTYLDVGGGLPVSGEIPRLGAERFEFRLTEYAQIILGAMDLIPSLEECWAENGRFLTSDSGVLVVRVLDIKYRRGQRLVLCDGGRTNHALVSDWERHVITAFPARDSSETVPTTVCGPTCMAFDQLDRLPLPSSLRIGDCLLWHNAGAYHIPWETRFSHGLAAVLWVDAEESIRVVRTAEGFAEWWASWRN